MSFALTNCCLTWHAANQNGTHTHIHTRIHIHVLYNVRHMCQARQRHHQHRRLAARTPILQLSAANSSITGGPGYQQQRERGRERGAYPSLPHPPTCSTIPKEKRVFISLPIVRKPNHNHKSNSYAALQSALKPKSESESETQSQLCSSPPPSFWYHWAFHFIRKSFDDCHRRCD